MKIYKYLLVLIFTGCRLLQGQAPIMDSSWMPRAGDKYYIFNLTFSPGANMDFMASDTGVNVTWDYNSNFSIDSTVSDSFDFVSPSARFINCSNPNANLADGDSANYQCFIKNSNGIYYTDIHKTGSAAFGKIIDTFLNPETFLVNNLNIRQVAYDTAIERYNFTYSYNDSNNKSIKYKTLKYDGFGTLKVLNIDFDSAIRLTEKNISHDSVYRDSLYYNITGIAHIYSWFIRSVHVPILKIANYWGVKWNGIGYDTIMYNKFVTFSQPSGGQCSFVFQIDKSNALFNGNNIMINNAAGKDLQYALYDMKGSLIKNGSANVCGNKSWKISAGHISPGMYILKIQDSSGGHQKAIKLVKQQ
jgi:hypothetical protein